MESNGECNKIHVSAATAKLIEAAGFRWVNQINYYADVPVQLKTNFLFFKISSHWLTLRENQIMVKGKGSMQTYWCHPKIKNSSGSGSGSDSRSSGPQDSKSNVDEFTASNEIIEV
jgi:hypothetical protein